MLHQGQVDAVQSSGAGGVSFVDFIDLKSAEYSCGQPFWRACESGQHRRGGRK